VESLFAEKLWIIPWSVLALVGLGIAAVYLFIDTSGGATGMRWIVLRWFHSLCWLLLAVAALGKARITPLPEAWAFPVGLAGGALYLIFIATTLMGRTV
jgi:hypothetical protein